jgi:heptosyltransferase-2
MKDDSYKVLIVAPAWVGDLVMSQTLFKMLRKQYGNRLQLDVFASLAMHSVLLRMPEVDRVLENPFVDKKLSLIKRVICGIKLRSNYYDEVFVLPNSLKSAIVPFLAGIKKRTGFVGEFRYGLLNNWFRLDKNKLPRMIDRFCALANHGELPYKIDNPQLTPDFHNQYQLIEKYYLSGLTEKLITFCPAAEYGPAKRWLPDYFAKLATQLIGEGYTVIILGSQKDLPLGEDIIKQSSLTSGIKNLCGLTTLSDTVDLLALAKVVITNDSGLMHIACAVNAGVVVVYGASSPAFTPPLSAKAQILRVPLDCAPCFKRTCQFGHYNCMKLVTPDVVYNAITARVNCDKISSSL